jgi:hypothetical protein
MAQQRDHATQSRVLRRFTLGSGPLKRASDRLEYFSRLLLVGVLLTAVAVALAVATAVYADGGPEASAQQAERHQVTALLEEDAVTSSDASGSVLALGRARAVWTGPSGAERTGVVPVAAGSEAGSTVSIWIDPDGTRTTRPLTSGDLAARGLGFGVLTYFVIAMFAWFAHDTFRRMLDRGRSRRWADEWAVVGPLWTGRVP